MSQLAMINLIIGAIFLNQLHDLALGSPLDLNRETKLPPWERKGADKVNLTNIKWNYLNYKTGKGNGVAMSNPVLKAPPNVDDFRPQSYKTCKFISFYERFFPVTNYFTYTCIYIYI